MSKGLVSEVPKTLLISGSLHIKISDVAIKQFTSVCIDLIANYSGNLQRILS